METECDGDPGAQLVNLGCEIMGSPGNWGCLIHGPVSFSAATRHCNGVGDNFDFPGKIPDSVVIRQLADLHPSNITSEMEKVERCKPRSSGEASRIQNSIAK